MDYNNKNGVISSPQVRMVHLSETPYLLMFAQCLPASNVLKVGQNGSVQ